MPENSRDPQERVRRRRATIGIVAAVVVVAAIGVVFWVNDYGSGSPAASDTTRVEAGASAEAPRPAPAAPPAPAAVDTFDAGARSIDDPASIWVVVNKLRPLNPIDFEADDLVEAPVPGYATLRSEAADAVVAMFDAATNEAGLYLRGDSAYRPFSSQQRVYDSEVSSYGQEAAELSTARPGYSEHQTGLAMDIGADSGECSIAACFGELPEGIWLRDNAFRFGFILRYPADKTDVTGYEYEPWHFRYVGVDLATELHDRGVSTLEEFFGLPAAPDYAE